MNDLATYFGHYFHSIKCFYIVLCLIYVKLYIVVVYLLANCFKQ